MCCTSRMSWYGTINLRRSASQPIHEFATARIERPATPVAIRGVQVQGLEHPKRLKKYENCHEDPQPFFRRNGVKRKKQKCDRLDKFWHILKQNTSLPLDKRQAEKNIAQQNRNDFDRLPLIFRKN